MEPAFVHHIDRKPRFHAAARAERMTDKALRRRDRYRPIEHRIHRLRFRYVAVARRRAVRVDVRDFAFVDTRVFKRHRKRKRLRRRVRARDVRTVRVRRKARDFRLPFGAAFYGVFHLFQN